MYVSRATRPDVTYATNKLARQVSGWTTADDKALEHLIGYLRTTEDCRLTSRIDVRDKKGELHLELSVDADHAGLEDRRSTGGWVLMLKGENGTSCPLDWGSRKQQAVARSSGEAETVALRDALQTIVGVNRGLCAAALPAVDTLTRWGNFSGGASS